MSDKILNKLQIKDRKQGIVFSLEQLEKENNEIQSELDKRINDILHKIEFTNANPQQAYKMYMKLQGFLRKRRIVKNKKGKRYIPRTETGNYIIDGYVTHRKRKNEN